jgi:hypothetical protein
LLRAGERLSGENLDRMARFYVQITAPGPADAVKASTL